eukprot:m.34661 g.34661  ORF g.34661 m.34661 type:complete len:194 (+) comp8759_c0_seq2:347-928(+)
MKTAILLVFIGAATLNTNAFDDIKAEKLQKLADEQVKAGQLQRGIELITQALDEAGPLNVRVRVAAGMIYARTDKTQAEKLYKKAIQAYRFSTARDRTTRRLVAMAYNNLCVMQHQSDSLEIAYENCKEAVNVSPNFWYPMKTMALIKEAWADVNEARSLYQKVYELSNDKGVRLHVTTMLPLVYESAVSHMN